MRDIHLISVPTNIGGERIGVAFGPYAVKITDVEEKVENEGVEISNRASIGGDDFPYFAASDTTVQSPNESVPQSIIDMSERTASAVETVMEQGGFPLTIGGDHSLAIGSINGSAEHGELGIIWFDAHGDFNTPETTPSGIVRGMPLAAVLGRGSFEDEKWAHASNLQEENVVIVGARALDEKEEQKLEESEVTVFSMEDIREEGIESIVEEAISIAGGDTDSIHVSLDVDVLDPEEAPGVGHPEPGGITEEEVKQALQKIAASQTELRSMDITDINPLQDQGNKTGELVSELVGTVAGGID